MFKINIPDYERKKERKKLRKKERKTKIRLTHKIQLIKKV